MELRVCRHCYTGEHGDERKTAITRDMVACAERIREYKDLVSLDSVHITKVGEEDTAAAEALPIVVAGIEGDTITLRDTQLVVEDDDGSVLVYPESKDVLYLLARNLDRIEERTREEIGVDLSSAGAELIG
jgi:regulator of RNase E activity RraA